MNWSEITDTLEPQLIAHARACIGRRLRSIVDPEDAVQEAISSAMNRYPDGFDSEREAAGVMRQAVRWIIAREARALPPATQSVDMERAEAPSGSTGVVTRADDLDRMRRTVAALPEHYREVIERIDMVTICPTSRGTSASVRRPPASGCFAPGA